MAALHVGAGFCLEPPLDERSVWCFTTQHSAAPGVLLGVAGQASAAGLSDDNPKAGWVPASPLVSHLPEGPKEELSEAVTGRHMRHCGT